MAIEGIAPCGIDCANCELHETGGIPAVQERAAAAMGVPVEKVRCKGCRVQGGCVIHPACATLDCVSAKGLDFCFECADFPCPKLNPAADRADRMPHNLKVFNLCRIKAVGPESFLAEAQETRRRYFTGKMVLGSGPQVSPPLA